MNAPTILSDLDIPAPIIEASMLVSNWMEEHGHRDWLCMRLASRSLYEKIACEIANLKTEHDAAKKELSQITDQLVLILKDVREAAIVAEQMKEDAKNFREDVFKLTTPATIEHIKNFKR